MLIGGMSLQKDREELIRHFKDNMSEPSDDDLRKIEELQENYKDKSDDEIFLEIIELNKDMQSNMSEQEYDEIFDKLENIKPLLDEEQKRKLEAIIRSLQE